MTDEPRDLDSRTATPPPTDGEREAQRLARMLRQWAKDTAMSPDEATRFRRAADLLNEHAESMAKLVKQVAQYGATLRETEQTLLRAMEVAERAVALCNETQRLTRRALGRDTSASL